MKKLKVAVSIVIAILIAVSASGCSLRIASFDNLVRPPKLSGKYQGLQDAFEASVDLSYDLKTPENGEYQSAFITFDIDSDGDEEALVFYSTKEQTDTVMFYYFEYTDDEWTPVASYNGLGNSVDQVIFSDINKDGKHEMIIGWSLFSSKTNKVFAVYNTSDKSVDLLNSFAYTYIDIIDVNGDGYDDIFTLTLDSSNPDQLAAYARSYNFGNTESSISMLSEVKTDGNISSYSSVKTEKVDETNLIYVEANKGEHEMITEIIYWNDETNSLNAPLFDVDSQTTKLTWRNTKVISYDVDADKYLEIPTSVEMRGSSVSATQTDNSAAIKNAMSNSLYFTRWVKFRDNSLRSVQYSVINETLGYMLNIQSSWVGRITVTGLDGQWNYYRWDSSTSSIGDMLFTINSYDKTNSEEKKKYASYKEIITSGNKTFVYKITEAGAKFGIKDKTITDSFTVTDFGGTK